MRCDYCDEPAAVAPESDGVRVGLCATHLREHVDGLQRALETADAPIGSR